VNIKLNAPLLLIVKVVLFILITWFIAERVFLSSDWQVQLDFLLQQIASANLWLLIAATVLMPLNWLLEIVKWKVLLQSDSSFKYLAKAVIAGITFGFVTPARSGEFVGRAMYLKETDRVKVFYLSNLGGVAQLAVTLAVGSCFFGYWSNNEFAGGALIGITVSVLFFYFRYDMLCSVTAGIPFLEKRGWHIEAHQLPDMSTSWWVLAISLLRYGVYLLQYVLLFSFMGVMPDYFMLFALCSVLLMAQVFSPFIPLVDVAYRGGTALYIFEHFAQNNIAVLSATTAVWLLNLVIPALLGYFFILKMKKL
jgi:uncharacterized membrane protein YbhN (UPF0104 family)